MRMKLTTILILECAVQIHAVMNVIATSWPSGPYARQRLPWRYKPPPTPFTPPSTTTAAPPPPTTPRAEPAVRVYQSTASPPVQRLQRLTRSSWWPGRHTELGRQLVQPIPRPYSHHRKPRNKTDIQHHKHTHHHSPPQRQKPATPTYLNQRQVANTPDLEQHPAPKQQKPPTPPFLHQRQVANITDLEQHPAPRQQKPSTPPLLHQRQVANIPDLHDHQNQKPVNYSIVQPAIPARLHRNQRSTDHYTKHYTSTRHRLGRLCRSFRRLVADSTLAVQLAIDSAGRLAMSRIMVGVAHRRMMRNWRQVERAYRKYRRLTSAQHVRKLCRHASQPDSSRKSAANSGGDGENRAKHRTRVALKQLDRVYSMRRKLERLRTVVRELTQLVQHREHIYKSEA